MMQMEEAFGHPVLDSVQQGLLDLHLKLLASDSKQVADEVFGRVSNMIPVDWGVFINCSQSGREISSIDSVHGINVTDESVYLQSDYLKSNSLASQMNAFNNTIFRLDSTDADEPECGRHTGGGPALVGKVSTDFQDEQLNCMFFLALDRQLDHAENQFMQSLMPCIQTYLLKVKQFDEQPSVTQKEAEVLKWISEGKTNWEIGVILSVSERTAKFHVHNLYKKFNVNSRSLLVARAIRQGCI
ncbi:helix-turn-helix transcriptional regulator [Thalassolituus sp.]|uniref:helix-turn-helix domain-containing protein n=1 Tax=Thalassolituus sp. TaxID=2030822 RepID=UPI00262134C7|nr:helix-turn-helix transcriptional regulator [uncultured Thalassolituus sp.]